MGVFTFRLLYVPARASGMANIGSTLTVILLGKDLGSSAWTEGHCSDASFFPSSQLLLLLLNYRCLSAEVFRHNAPQHPVLDKSGQFSINGAFQGGRRHPEN